MSIKENVDVRICEGCKKLAEVGEETEQWVSIELTGYDDSGGGYHLG